MMSYFERLKNEFDVVITEFNASPVLEKLASGTITVEHYKSYLRQTYHYTKDNPQIQALATVYFRGNDREFVRMFYKHAISEIGHDQLALNDLALLGGGIDEVKLENPLPSTIALNAFVYWQIYNHNPIGYLGYLFFLEFMPTSQGAQYMDLFESIGVPREAMSFLLEHATVDVAHNKLMEKYAENLIQNEEDYLTIVYTMKVTAKLFADMLAGAYEQAENPKDWGVNYLEVSRTVAS